jgi:hypothetical protein
MVKSGVLFEVRTELLILFRRTSASDDQTSNFLYHERKERKAKNKDKGKSENIYR